MEHKLPPLPFAMDALEPHMSRETLEYHYGKHHKTYVEKLNQLIKDTEHENEDLEQIVKTAKGPIFNNAAQAWNHTFFWSCLTPERGLEPREELSRAIDASFGSMDAFKDKFTKTAVELFGSGWAWLVCDASGKLSIEAAPNAGTPLTGKKMPLLTCDVWEHAYYIDHRNARPDFLKAYWNLVNWDFARSNFETARGRGARTRSGAAA